METSKCKIGDRVRVLRAAFGLDAFAGREGVIARFGAPLEGVTADALIALDRSNVEVWITPRRLELASVCDACDGKAAL